MAPQTGASLMRILSKPLFSLVAAIVLFGVPATLSAQQARPAPTVTVVTLEPQDVTLTVRLPGRVAASRIAEVRPQVSGIITKQLFEEGKSVKAGDALYEIDPASYEVRMAAAEASLAQAKASLAAAERDAKRQEELRQRNVSPQQALDDALAQKDVASAAVKVAEANVLAAKIDLERTTITAPISGVTGLSEVSEGALVTSGQATPLTVIRRLDPIYVDVTQSATEVLRWRRAGEEIGSAGQVVTLRLADGTVFEQAGALAAAEPHVDEQTGTILLRLQFPNPDSFLLPGMYVQVEMPEGHIPGALLVPQEGVTRDRRGRPTAMIVNAEGTVESRELEIQRDQGAFWVVTSGLSAGDRVIVEGLQKVAPGAPAQAEERAARPAASN
ncbi:efflux RND transporter periplasmic adaptor subunit [Rhodobacteraceae bacterium GS-10]|uniref:Efflux RND transporter periplasmic adaptor subunit n=2 Tax=Thalassovita mangrovi TaxID=2692236 RepID=A0A6L8LUT3_9RHOB|nr:efflux RND transporter periplasmic adaptor subunit [Thalassovita mangrovi]